MFLSGDGIVGCTFTPMISRTLAFLWPPAGARIQLGSSWYAQSNMEPSSMGSAPGWIFTLSGILRRAFAPDSWPTWALVAVGCWAARIAIRTLKAIEHEAQIANGISNAARDNAIAARDNAKAAELSSKALINIERPWMMLGKIEPRDLWATLFNRTPMPNLTVTFKNFGRTPAWIVESAFRFVLAGRTVGQSPLDYGATISLPHGEPVPPGAEAVKVIVSLESSSEITDNALRAIEFGSSHLILYGFVKYRDPFFENTREVRETYFCLRFFVKPTGSPTAPAQWIYYGPDGANKHT